MSHPKDDETIEFEQQVSDTTVLMPLVEPQPSPTAAETVWHICVEVVSGPMDGLRNRVETPQFTLGRESDNHLPLTLDPMVSGHHARIVREGHHFWLEDLGSKNGVYLGDRKLSKRALIGPGTTFTLGQTELEFMPH